LFKGIKTVLPLDNKTQKKLNHENLKLFLKTVVWFFTLWGCAVLQMLSPYIFGDIWV